MTAQAQLQDQGRGDEPRNRWGLWLLVPLIACTIAIFVFSHEWKKSLKLRHIEVEGLRALSVQEITALTRVPVGTPLFDVDLAGAQQRIAANPFVRVASISRQFPDLLKISVQEREPIATVNGGQGLYI